MRDFVELPVKLACIGTQLKKFFNKYFWGMLMNWFEAVDGYCERIDGSFWSEPLNAISNIFFLVAAMWVLRRGSLNNTARILVFILGMIGIASFLFHSFAQTWAGALDGLFILFFTLFYLFAASKDFLGAPRSIALVITLGYFPFAFAVDWLTSPLTFLGATRIYMPILILIILFSILIYTRLPTVSRGLALGAFILIASMCARFLDEPLCQTIPIGTHFLWHVMNAVMLAWMIEVYRRHIVSQNCNI